LNDKDEIKELFQEKLGNYQSKVDPKIWQGVQSGLSSGAAAGTSLSIATKLGIGVLSTAVITAASIFIYNQLDHKDEVPTTTAKTENSIETNTEELDREETPIELSPIQETGEDDINTVSEESDQSVVHPKVNQASDHDQKTKVEESFSESDRSYVPPTNLPETKPKLVESNKSSVTNDEQSKEKSSKEVDGKRTVDWNLEPSIVEQKNQYIQFQLTGNEYIEKIQWDFGDGHFSDQLNPEHFYTETGTYEVSVQATMNNQVKERTIEVRIEIEGEITRLPNTFTPNSDGQNDQFFVESKGLKEFQINIMNDERKIVYQSNKKDFRWDGTALNGQPVPEGRYVYIIMARDEKGNTINKYKQLHILR